MSLAHPFELSEFSRPVFRDGASHVYRADNCTPLVEAAQAQRLKMEALARGHYPGRRLTEDALPGVKTVGHWDADTEQTWGLPWHRNEGIEISYLESGTLDAGVDGREFTLEAGELLVTRPWQSHRLGRPNLKPNRLHWLIIDVGVRRPNQAWKWPRWFILSPGEAGELERNLRENARSVWRASPDIRHCFHLIGQAVEKDLSGSHSSRLGIRINELFLLLLDLFRAHSMRPEHWCTESRQTVRSFLSYLDSTPDTLVAPWTLEGMAERCGLKPTQFVRYVKELSNMAPLHYLNRCRLEYSARLLRNRPSMPVTEIALSCGFSSSQYFATLFRRHFGATPSAYRAG